MIDIATTSNGFPSTGALVISLDFELMWGVRDIVAEDSPYVANIRGVHQAIPRMLDLFAQFDVSATWATVGGLFAESLEEFQEFAPRVLPTYEDARLSPYPTLDRFDHENEDLYFAPELVQEIACRPRQELASHTFSHYYCLEPGQTAEQFEADLASAQRIASSKGYEMSSLVYPRNQMNLDYLPILGKLGFTAVRGLGTGRTGPARATSEETVLHRGYRLIDAFMNLSGTGAFPWNSIPIRQGMADVRASRFLRPFIAQRRINEAALERVRAGIRQAATDGLVYHLWWHPHNFGVSLEENLGNLGSILEVFSELRDAVGFTSLSMRDVAERTVGKPCSIPAGPPADL